MDVAGYWLLVAGFLTRNKEQAPSTLN